MQKIVATASNIALETFTEHTHSMVTKDFMSIFSNEAPGSAFLIVSL